jgi:RNA polymerase sigma factor (sigma-70 family)
MGNRAAAILAKANRAALAGVNDRELLQRYTKSGDQPTFEEIVRRHSSMVLGVCRRSLSSQADSEDAVQAVFLLLANKASSGRWQESLANWLYETARKVSANVRRNTKRRVHREATAAVLEKVSSSDDVSGLELGAVLDEELDKLKAVYREPLVLCYLEGLTRDEAATRLAIPINTLNKRLERGRKQLAELLTARGYGLGVALVLGVVPYAAASPSFISSILATVGGCPSAAVSALVQEVLMNSVLWKAKLGVMSFFGLTMLGLGFASLPTAAQPLKPVAQAVLKAEPAPDAKPQEKKPDANLRTITGQVLGHDGKPIQGELELVWSDVKTESLGKTDANGRFNLTIPMTRGKYKRGGHLLAKAPGHGIDFRYHGYDFDPESKTPTAEITFRLAKERLLTGRLVDEKSKPVVGAKVAARRISVFNDRSLIEERLLKWARNGSYSNAPGADRNLGYDDGVAGQENSKYSPHFAVTNQEGNFAIPGLGEGHLVILFIRGIKMRLIRSRSSK